MAQHNNITETRTEYTRTDFAALRARFNNLDAGYMWGLYGEEELESRGIATQAALLEWLDGLQDHLLQRARQANPNVAAILEDAKRRRRWSHSLIEFVFKAGEQDRSKPKLTDGISVWFKPIVFRTLAEEGLHTLKDLKDCIEQRGSGWYRPIPRIGPGKARIFERWLEAHQETLGALKRLPERVDANQELLQPGPSTVLLPLERISAIAHPLNGSQGRNRNSAYCLISAGNDLEAIHAYLSRFDGREKTRRAYQKELERFLLWCVMERRVAMSSILGEDCTAYMAFLKNPGAAWVGPKHAKTSPKWLPFASALSPKSQKYAVQVIRYFFEWLMRVRYLGGNPWATVPDPVVVEDEVWLDIDKALPEKLWSALTAKNGLLDRACQADGTAANLQGYPLSSKTEIVPQVQYRLARAIIFLMGYSGIRREEAALATREYLAPAPDVPEVEKGIWALTVIGKRKKKRVVWVPKRTIASLKAHWEDRGHDFEDGTSKFALLSPMVAPNTPHAQKRHLHAIEEGGTLRGLGFTPDGIYKVVKSALVRLAGDPGVPLLDEERDLLRQAAPHAFRHTFATRAVAHNMPIDVLQRLMGHDSQQITSIYVQAERNRSLIEAAKFFDE